MPPREDANVWDLAQYELQQQLDDYSFKNWLRPTRFQSFEGGRLTVGVPSQFFADWLRDHYMDAVCDTLRRISSDFTSIAFVPSSDAKAAHS